MPFPANPDDTGYEFSDLRIGVSTPAIGARCHQFDQSTTRTAWSALAGWLRA